MFPFRKISKEAEEKVTNARSLVEKILQENKGDRKSEHIFSSMSSDVNKNVNAIIFSPY